MLRTLNTSKEIIKNRMLKHAISYWGLKNTEDIDPVVKLLMEALSLELSNLGNEVKDGQARILEKIAGLLTPDPLTSPDPAHAIMHALPVEATEIIEKTTDFFTPLKIALNENEEARSTIDMHFTPVENVRINHVQIVNMASGGNLYSYGPGFGKILLARSTSRVPEGNTLWLGLKVHPLLNSIDGLSVYFDWKNLEPVLSNRLFPLLPLGKWYTGGQEISIVPGIRYSNERKHKHEEGNIFQEYDLLSIKEKDVREFYDRRFITIEDVPFAGDLRDTYATYPDEFENMFALMDLQKLTEKLLWIKIVFPAAMEKDYLNEIYAYTNSFPVMNRKITDLKFRLKGGSNIIPLRTEVPDQFLFVRSLSDDSREYRPVPYRKNEEEQFGTYTLRMGGVEKFDDRNARDLISYLLELLRSESAAFAAYGYDFIATTLKELNQRMFVMEQKTHGSANQSSALTSYIIVKPFEGKEMMYTEYWTTLAELANNIRGGTKIQQTRGVKLVQDSVVLITTTMGGKNRLRPEEKLNAFRYGLTTRDRIITREDIRNFCRYELGENAGKIDIRKGFEMCVDNKQGFRRTIDIIVTIPQKNTMEDQDWELTAQQMISRLRVRSGMMNNYRVIIKHEIQL